jgi:hypothetical protein
MVSNHELEATDNDVAAAWFNALSWGNLQNNDKRPVRRAGLRARILTRHLPSTKHECLTARPRRSVCVNRKYVWFCNKRATPKSAGLVTSSHITPGYSCTQICVRGNFLQSNIIILLLTCIPEMKVGLSNHQSVCLSACLSVSYPTSNFKQHGTFSWNLLRR